MPWYQRWIFTTEFWMTAVTEGLLWQMSSASEQVNEWGLLAMGVTAGAYAWSRGSAKAKSG